MVHPRVRPTLHSVGSFLGTAFSGRYRWLMWALIALLIGSPFLAHLPFYRGERAGLYVGDLVTGAVYFVAIRTYHRHPSQFWLLLLLGVVSVATGFIARVFPNAAVPLTVISLGCTGAMLLAIGLLISLQVFTAAEVDGDTICGSVSIYLLLAGTFASIYSLIAVVSPTAFELSPHVSLDDPTLGPDRLLVYFSFVTLTTVGYGDVVPGNDLTRPLSNLQAVIGQFYLAVLVARLVGQHLTRSMRSTPAET
jgi:uncharacterized membrane protein HdeD (DUF308 family)